MPTTPPAIALTPQQKACLATIMRLMKRHGYSPTPQEIADEMSISRSRVLNHIAELERKEYVTRDPRLARTLRVVA